MNIAVQVVVPPWQNLRGVVEDVRTLHDDAPVPPGGPELVRELQRLCAEQDAEFLKTLERLAELKALLASRDQDQQRAA